MMPREQARAGGQVGERGGLEGSTRTRTRGGRCLQPIGCRRSITLRSGGTEGQTETERDVQCARGGRDLLPAGRRAQVRERQNRLLLSVCLPACLVVSLSVSVFLVTDRFCSLRVTFKAFTKVSNAVEFTLNKEDHTLGNTLRMCAPPPPPRPSATPTPAHSERGAPFARAANC